MYAKAVGSYIPRLTRKAFEKYGFSTAALLMDWSRIVGAEVADVAIPERLKWPPQIASGGERGEGTKGRSAATLVLRVDPARALEVDYRGRQIIERINGYFGYRAIAELRLIQGPLGPARRAPSSEGTPDRDPPQIRSSSRGDPLADALARLAAAVTRGRASGPRLA
jgi:hypothetical protein